MKYLLLNIFFLFLLPDKIVCQVKYQGVTRLTGQQAIKNINGTWNSADRTGNAKLDKAFDQYAAANRFNVRSIRALEAVAAAIRTEPQNFLNPDGSVNIGALQSVINEKFANIPEVTIPGFKVAGDSTSMREPGAGK